MKCLALAIALIACVRVSAQNQPQNVGNTFTRIARLQQRQAPGRTSADMFERTHKKHGA
jgi:hypothetical protein